MDFLKKITQIDELTKIGISIITLGVVLEVLFKGVNIPFYPEVSVVDNVMGYFRKFEYTEGPFRTGWKYLHFTT